MLINISLLHNNIQQWCFSWEEVCHKETLKGKKGLHLLFKISSNQPQTVILSHNTVQYWSVVNWYMSSEAVMMKDENSLFEELKFLKAT